MDKITQQIIEMQKHLETLETLKPKIKALANLGKKQYAICKILAQAGYKYTPYEIKKVLEELANNETTPPPVITKEETQPLPSPDKTELKKAQNTKELLQQAREEMKKRRMEEKTAKEKQSKPFVAE